MQLRKLLRKGTVYNFYWFERGGGRIYLGQITSGSHLWYKIQDFEQKIRLTTATTIFPFWLGPAAAVSWLEFCWFGLLAGGAG